MKSYQPGILAPVPKQSRYLFFSEVPKADLASALGFLRDHVDGESAVLGIGNSVAQELESQIPGLKNFAAPVGSRVEIPATPFSLFIWLRGGDRGELLHRSRGLEKGLAASFLLAESADAFMYKDGRDLTGYVDGTENPEGKKALSAAFVSGRGAGLDGSSFLAVQRWIHDLDTFDAMGQKERDDSVGRRQKDNVELTEAPPTAHVKRTAQESFTPEAFILRRSMPWSDGQKSGLIFTAFGKSFDAFEAQLRRMSGAEDGITDALFRFTKPITTAYFWCPPVDKGKVDLRLFPGR
jgi:putative iron-dependent peroxidase